jgi:hypothetical protein
MMMALLGEVVEEITIIEIPIVVETTGINPTSTIIVAVKILPPFHNFIKYTAVEWLR